MQLNFGFAQAGKPYEHWLYTDGGSNVLLKHKQTEDLLLIPREQYELEVKLGRLLAVGEYAINGIPLTSKRISKISKLIPIKCDNCGIIVFKPGRILRQTFKNKHEYCGYQCAAEGRSKYGTRSNVR